MQGLEEGFKSKERPTRQDIREVAYDLYNGEEGKYFLKILSSIDTTTDLSKGYSNLREIFPGWTVEDFLQLEEDWSDLLIDCNRYESKTPEIIKSVAQEIINSRELEGAFAAAMDGDYPSPLWQDYRTVTFSDWTRSDINKVLDIVDASNGDF